MIEEADFFEGDVDPVGDGFEGFFEAEVECFGVVEGAEIDLVREFHA